METQVLTTVPVAGASCRVAGFPNPVVQKTKPLLLNWSNFVQTHWQTVVISLLCREERVEIQVSCNLIIKEKPKLWCQQESICGLWYIINFCNLNYFSTVLLLFIICIASWNSVFLRDSKQFRDFLFFFFLYFFLF